ncbi:hypothetical protein FGG08_006828 [Glutinoglossum americanum]|uniref:Uncharacterized protein n=1 Tax=Glutinoglossum americanum TaxID=1670608 RepID=A0A9P8HRX1_9PEZI|nr:hypothetical protein FGG08_006828 [Glutinoglossum americanum]
MPRTSAKLRKAKPKTTVMAAGASARVTRSTKAKAASTTATATAPAPAPTATSATVASSTAVATPTTAAPTAAPAAVASSATVVPSAAAPAASGPQRPPGRALRSRGACSPNMSLEKLQQLTRKPRKPRGFSIPKPIEEDAASQEHAGETADETTGETTGATTGESSGEVQTGESASESVVYQIDESVTGAVSTDQDPSGNDFDGEVDTSHHAPTPSPSQVFSAQVPSAQVLPEQMLPTQVSPTQVLTEPVLPTPVLPAQVLPAQVLPAQALPAEELSELVLPSPVSYVPLGPVQMSIERVFRARSLRAPVAAPWYIDQAVQTELPPPCTGAEGNLAAKVTTVVGYTTSSPREFSSFRTQGLILTREELELILDHRKSKKLRRARRAKARNATDWQSIFYGSADLPDDNAADTNTFLRDGDPLINDETLQLHDLFPDAEDLKWITGNASFFQDPLPFKPEVELNDVSMHDVSMLDVADESLDGSPGTFSDRVRRRGSAGSTPGPENRNEQAVSAVTPQPATPKVTTPLNKTWGIFSLSNTIARGLTSTVSSLLGQSQQAVNNTNPEDTPSAQQAVTALENVARLDGQGSAKRVRLDGQDNSKGVKRPRKNEEEPEHTARLQQDLQRVKQTEAKRQKYEASPRSSRVKRTPPIRALSSLRNVSTCRVSSTLQMESPFTKKRNYYSTPGSYSLPEELFDSSESDEPVTSPERASPSKEKATSRKRVSTSSAERPAKKPKVVPPVTPRKSPPRTTKPVKEKRLFSPPPGASYGLSDAFYDYTSSEDSDDDGVEGEVVREVVRPSHDTIMSDTPQTTTTKPPQFLTPSRQDPQVVDNREDTWTKPPPPPPTPAHAKLPGDRVAEATENPALAKARSLTEQYKPANPSRLRRVSILSASTASPTPSPRARLEDLAGQDEWPQQRETQQEAREEETRGEEETGIESNGRDGGYSSQLVWSEKDVFGLNIDPEVLRALNDNWTKEDEERAYKDWAPFFEEFKKNNELSA